MAAVATSVHRPATWPAPDPSNALPRPPLVRRQCSRTGCSDSAAFTLTYHYSGSQVWLDALSIERDPHAYDLCDRHAERLSVPNGWHVEDRRGLAHVRLVS